MSSHLLFTINALVVIRRNLISFLTKKGPRPEATLLGRISLHKGPQKKEIATKPSSIPRPLDKKLEIAMGSSSTKEDDALNLFFFFDTVIRSLFIR
jgi:hypothetical protein